MRLVRREVDPKGLGLQPLSEPILQGLKPGYLTLLRLV